jgi:hypothetical protein
MINEQAVQELRRQTHSLVRAWFARFAGDGDLLRRVSFEINVTFSEASDYVTRSPDSPGALQQLALKLFGDSTGVHQEGESNE